MALSKLSIRITTDGLIYIPTPPATAMDLAGGERNASEPNTSIEEHSPKSNRLERVDPIHCSIELTQLPQLWADLLEDHPLLGSSPLAAIYFPSSHYTIIPRNMTGNSDDAWWRLTAPHYASTDQYYQGTYSLGVGLPSLAAGGERTLLGFLARSIVGSSFTPSVFPFFQQVLQHASSHTLPTLGVEVYAGGADIILAKSGQLIQANHYSWAPIQSLSQQLYQVLYFLSKYYFAEQTNSGTPIHIILSDGGGGYNSLSAELTAQLQRQFEIAQWPIILLPVLYWAL